MIRCNYISRKSSHVNVPFKKWKQKQWIVTQSKREIICGHNESCFNEQVSSPLRAFLSPKVFKETSICTCSLIPSGKYIQVKPANSGGDGSVHGTVSRGNRFSRLRKLLLDLIMNAECIHYTCILWSPRVHVQRDMRAMCVEVKRTCKRR